MNTPPVRVGIIGLVRSGWSIHALGLQRMPERFRIVAVADLIAARRAEAQQMFGAIAEHDLRTPGCTSPPGRAYRRSTGMMFIT